MKTNKLATVIRLANPQFWLLTIGSGLIAIHLTLVWKAENTNLLGTSFLSWAAVSFIVWEKRDNLNLESGVLSSFLGLALIWIALIRSASLSSFGGFLYALPFIFGLGLALIASGFQGLKQYIGELITLLFLSIPKLLPEWVIYKITLLTAKSSAFILWYIGFDVTLAGINIYLPNGSVEVLHGCSGIDLISQMLGLAVLFLLMFPQAWQYKILVPIVAATVGFIMNSGRVALMTVLVAKDNINAFDYWHSGNGSLLFSIISVLIFGLFCWIIIGHDESKDAKF
ncbi:MULTISPECIES: cyanoexosortase A [Fischerella]|uniref:Cyanoexosortase A n=1 Tax=Fischerella muscicola CCMEE 5323 TaxID=2019572 RepID=A0A2N6JZS9_FISMU|nr:MULTISPECIES: cyanoexosortase A [Fischerella]MBD2433364.1 cyanoexosortase A [Fischerella sp. FACHB-380]PLZ87026.1 cyanoexosortase A [Fischerella muscicola CCMEE 5323]